MASVASCPRALRVVPCGSNASSFLVNPEACFLPHTPHPTRAEQGRRPAEKDWRQARVLPGTRHSQCALALHRQCARAISAHAESMHAFSTDAPATRRGSGGQPRAPALGASAAASCVWAAGPPPHLMHARGSARARERSRANGTAPPPPNTQLVRSFRNWPGGCSPLTDGCPRKV